MGEFRMPSLGAEMTEGRLIEWLVAPGAEVHRGDVVAVVETDKAALEVEIWEDGTVQELLVSEGAKVPVGTPLALVGGRDASLPSVTPPPPQQPAERPSVDRSGVAPSEARELEVARAGIDRPGTVRPPVRGPLARRRAEMLGVDLAAVRGTAPGGAITRHDVEEAGRSPSRPRVSPYARRLAQERGLDPTVLPGTGPGGAVVAGDVLSGVPAPPVRTEPGPAGSSMRAAIARAMARSNREIPHYYLGTQIDVTDTLAWLDARNADHAAAEHVLPAALELRAVALALREHPELNGSWVNDGFVPGTSIDLGVAVALRGGGLVAPVLRGADELSLDALMAQLRAVVRRARAGRLRASEATDATATVTNLGDLGVEAVYGVIHPPQVALIGFGRVSERPWVVDGSIVARRLLHATLAGDHRQTDGQLGARFLTTLTDLLQRPEDL